MLRITKIIDKIDDAIVRKLINDWNYESERQSYDLAMEHGEKNIPEELHFIFGLKRREGLDFVRMIHNQFGLFYYPGHRLRDNAADSRIYYELKREFLAKKNHEPYVRNDEVFRVHYIPMCIFPTKEARDIAFGVMNKFQDEIVNGNINDQSDGKKPRERA